MNTFLVVGAGLGQLPAIIAAKKCGYRVVAVDRNPDAVGMEYADEAYPIDIVDAESVVALAKQFGVSGVMTMQSDAGVVTVGAVVDALGLPGSGADVARRCSNKILTRECLLEAGISQPQFAVVSNIDEAKSFAAEIGFPCIVKPPDSSGSRGVSKVNGLSGVASAFYEAVKCSRGEHILVEEYIDGYEVGAQSISLGGDCELVFVHDDFLSPPPFMVPIGHSFPSRLNEDEHNRVKCLVSRCVEVLGIKDGPANIDVIIDKNGYPKIIEVGARIGATCLPELVSYYTGVDWVMLAVGIASGGISEIKFNALFRSCAAFILEAPRDGVFNGYLFPEEYLSCDKIIEFEVEARAGDRVSCLRKGTDRIGRLLVSGVNASEAVDVAHKIRNKVRIDVRNGY